MKIFYKISMLLACFMVFTTMKAQEGILPGKVRIKLKRESVERLAPSLRSSRATITYEGVGLPRLDQTLRNAKTSSLKRMIPYSPRFDARHKASGVDLWYEVKIGDSENVQDMVNRLAELEEVQIAQPVYVIESNQLSGTLPFNDPFLKKQWNYNNTGLHEAGFPFGKAGADIDLFKAWEITTGKSDVIVAIIDGGVDITHPDLKANLWINESEASGNPFTDDDGNGYLDDIHGHDFVSGNLSIEATGHGTHVAGIVAAKNNNNIGISGVAGGTGNSDGVRLMSCQILSADGQTGDAAAAFIYAADNGAVIAQCSWSYRFARMKDQSILDAIDYFIKFAGKDDEGINPRPNTRMNGGLVVFAAGNIGVDDIYYPSYYEKCFTVAALDIYGKKPAYSNYGKWVDISAPGGSEKSGGSYGMISSTISGSSYGYMEGTSMACPHVSGVAALLLSHYGNEAYTPEMLKYRIAASAADINSDNPDYAGKLGAGLLKAYGAFDQNIPDVEANLYFGTFPLNAKESHELSLRIMNSTDKEMILKDFRLSSSQYQVNGFTIGKTLGKGEYINLNVIYTPQEYGEYRDTLILQYGGDFEGVSSSTLLLSNVLDAEEKNEYVLFSDDFELGDSRWHRYDKDRDGKSWLQQSDLPSRFHARSGASYVMSESGAFSNGEYVHYNPNNWLISPVLDLSEVKAGEKVDLSYWIRTAAPIYDKVSYKLLLSESEAEEINPDSFSHELLSEVLTTPDQNDGYNYRKVSLSDFAGKKVKIAFVHIDSPQTLWLIIDDFKVNYFPERDYTEIAVEQFGLNNYEMTSTETVPVVVHLSNRGNLPAEQVSVSYRLGSGETVTETIDAIPEQTIIQYRFAKELTVGYTSDTDTLHVEVSPLDNELFVRNNQLSEVVWINKYPTAYLWNFEEKDGAVTWPKEFTRVRLDNQTASGNLVYTQWGNKWATNREEFLVARFLRSLHPSLGALSTVSTSCFTTDGQADRWIVASIPAIETDSLLLKWTAASYDPQRQEDYEVLASTTAYPKMQASAGGFDQGDFELLQAYPETPDKLSMNCLDLTNYAGRDFCFAFRHTTAGSGSILLFDNIRLLAKDYSGGSGITSNKVNTNGLTYTLKEGLLTIESQEEIQKVEIFDISGRMVTSISVLHSFKEYLSLSHLHTGYYLLKVSMQSEAQVIKFRLTN